MYGESLLSPVATTESSLKVIVISTSARSRLEQNRIEWHREQIEQNRATLKELENGNTAGGEVFPETQSQIDVLNKQIAQSKLIVAAYDKKHPEP